ncbi:MAG: hypothetical protein ACPW61_06695 [Methyloligella sp. ZOD6]
MDTSIFIAKLLGPAMLVLGIAFLVNRSAYRAMAKEFLASPALVFIAGLTALALGLPLVVTHNVWVWGWPVAITIIGWLSLVAGIVRLVMPWAIRDAGQRMAESDGLMIGAGIFYLALGLWLSLAGYLGWGS